jgi:putative transposase
VTTYRFIHAEEANHSVRTLCRVLRVSRSSFYEWRAGATHTGAADARLAVHIRAIHRHHKGRYGAPRVTQELQAQGFVVGRRRVARLMRDGGLAGRPRRRFRGSTTDSKHDRPVAPNLLERDFTADRPNQVFVGDITYLPVRGGWVYLAVIIDLFSRKVVGWAMEDHMETSLCLKALRQVTATREGLDGGVHHTDRGSQYASADYRKALKQAGLVQSMSRKGDCWDNAVAESFFGTLEQELVDGQVWQDLPAAKKAVGDYIHRYYNAERRHSTIGGVSPIDFENQHHAACSVAA